MILRVFGVFAFIIIVSNNAIAQRIEAISIVENKEGSLFFDRCPEFAGDVTIVNFDGQSNDFSQDGGPIYLCFNDQFKADNNATLADVECNDPDPFTLPGIGYGFYKGPPSISGPASNAVIAGDPNIEDMPPAPSGFWWTYGDERLGDAQFFNQGQIQAFFNSGNPEQMWFAPHTYDDFATRTAAESGGQVHVNIDAAFSVIYLNEIEINDKQTDVGGNPLAGRFDISGGLPEWDGSDYVDLGIVKVGDPSVQGTITSGSLSHNSTIDFTVPEMGTYLIYAEDGKSCGASMEILFSDNTENITINIGNTSGIPGATECISFCVEDFVDVGSMQFTIAFDPNIMEYNTITGINLLGLSESGSFNFIDVDNGIIRLVWFDNSTLGQTLNDGDCIFELCFNILSDAQPGDCTPLSITDSPTPIDIGTPEGVDIGLNTNAGELCVVPESSLTAYVNTCNSASGSFSGSISFQVYGGSAPYTYDLPGQMINGIINNPGDEIFIGNLAPGSYVLVVEDATGTIETITNIVVGSGSDLTVDLDGIDPSCFNFTNGSITANVSGGVPFMDGSFQYEWSNQLFNTPTISSLTRGNYTVTVTDANGCEATDAEFIGVDPIDVELTTIAIPTCESSNNGILSATASGGTSASGEYTFQWSAPNSLFQQTSLSQNDMIRPGLSSVRITDDAGCTWEEFFDLGFEKELRANVVIDDGLLCFGDSNGIVRIFGEYADGSSFNLDNINSNTSEPGIFFQFGPDHIRGPDVPPGIYDVTLTDSNNGCTVDTTINLEVPDEIIINAVPNFDCASGAGGTIDLTVTGGVGMYTFDWSDGNTDEDRIDLAAGTYTVTVTDGNGCTQVENVMLDASSSISITSFIVNPIGCEGNETGEITAVVDGGGSMINYLWDWDGPGMTFPDDPSLVNLAAGWYYLTVTDLENGCTDMDSIELVEGSAFTVDIIEELPFCNGESSGVLAAVVSGGNGGPFNYDWDHPNDSGTEILSNIASGAYGLTISEVGGCTLDTIVTLSPQDTIDISITIDSDPLCFDSQDGQATVLASGGKVDNGNYGFIWSSGETQPFPSTNVSVATMLGTGDQFVIVRDEECADTLNFIMTGPDSITIDPNLSIISNVSCFGLSDGNAQVFFTGGTPAYNLDWPGLGISGNSLSNLSAGAYDFLITDANGCQQNDTLLITQPDSLILTVDSLNSASLGCSGDSDGAIFLLTSGGNIGTEFNYQWSGDVSNSDFATGLAEGLYTVTVTDELGCSDSTSYEVMAPLPIIVDLPTPDDPVCFGDQTCIGINSVSGGSGPDYRFSVNNGPLFSIDSCVNVFAGTYDISIFDNTGCSYDTSLVINEPQELILNLGPDFEVDLGDSTTTIDPTIIGPNPISQVFWNPVEGINCLSDDCSRVVVFPTSNTLYEVLVEDILGCTATDEILVTVNDAVRVYFPNAFSPNGDGINDIFNLFTGTGVVEIPEFRVYDRWGNQMYQVRNVPASRGGTEGWDGRFNGTMVDSGVYTYFAKVTLVNGRTVNVRGDVTLMR